MDIGPFLDWGSSQGAKLFRLFGLVNKYNFSRWWYLMSNRLVIFKVLSSELWNENMVAAWFQSLSPFQTEKESFNSSMILANVSCCGRRTEPQPGSSDLPVWHIKARKSTGQSSPKCWRQSISRVYPAVIKHGNWKSVIWWFYKAKSFVNGGIFHCMLPDGIYSRSIRSLFPVTLFGFRSAKKWVS